MSTIDLPSRSFRTPFEDVSGTPNPGASPSGSTYWRRVQHCPREHLLANVLRWDPVPRAQALDVGLLWHACLEAFYRQVMAEQQGQRFERSPHYAAFMVLQPFRDADGWAEHYETIGKMLQHYFERWEQADRFWEILGVECSVEIPPEWFGVWYTSRLDLLIKDHSGPAPVGRHVEHKSAWQLEVNVIQGYTQDDQVLGQVFLCDRRIDWNALGVPYVGAIVNVTTKQSTPKSERIPVQPSDEQLRAWLESKLYWQHYRGTLEASGYYPKNFTLCVRRFGRCAYFDYCRFAPGENMPEILARDRNDDLPQGFRRLVVLPAD